MSFWVCFHWNFHSKMLPYGLNQLSKTFQRPIRNMAKMLVLVFSVERRSIFLHFCFLFTWRFGKQFNCHALRLRKRLLTILALRSLPMISNHETQENTKWKSCEIVGQFLRKRSQISSQNFQTFSIIENLKPFILIHLPPSFVL